MELNWTKNFWIDAAANLHSGDTDLTAWILGHRVDGGAHAILKRRHR